MNILHVLSQFEVTGAEVYAVTVASAQRRHGHTVTIVSDRLHLPFDGIFISQPIGKRSYVQRFQNIKFLVQIIRKNKIDIVHGHSRAASWVCNLATLYTGIPFVSTIHGRQHLHLSSRTWSVCGKNIIAVSESLKEHLIQELRLTPDHITTIPNGFDTRHWINAASATPVRNIFGAPDHVPVLLFVGRFSGPKGDVVRFLISRAYPELVKRMPCSLQIIGGFSIPQDILQCVQEMQQRFGATSVVVREYQSNIIPYLCAASVVIGSGRVVMESLMAEKPTVAFGESGYEGLVDPAHYEKIRLTNFGDTGIQNPLNTELIVNDLVKILTQSPSPADATLLQKRIEDTCDINLIERKIDTVYQSAIAETKSPATIPVLMYHRVIPEAPVGSHHGIWVTAPSFEQQLRSLKRRGYSTITFEQYQLFLNGEFTLPRKPIILSFDDGYEDNYTCAFPLLEKHGFSAAVFLVTDSARRTNFWDEEEPQVPLMNKMQINEMSRAGIEFGSHTVTHPDLAHCSPEKMRNEFVDSKQTIEQWTGKAIISCAYPYGSVNKSIKATAAEAGYTFGIATNSGPVEFFKDFYEVRRTQIFPWTGSFGFWKKTQPWYGKYKQRKTIMAI